MQCGRHKLALWLGTSKKLTDKSFFVRLLWFHHSASTIISEIFSDNNTHCSGGLLLDLLLLRTIVIIRHLLTLNLSYRKHNMHPLPMTLLASWPADPKERTNDISSAYTDTLLHQLMVSRPFIAAGAIKCARSLVGSGWLLLLLYAVTPHYHRNWTVRRHRSHCCSSCCCCSWMRAVLLRTHPCKHTYISTHDHKCINQMVQSTFFLV